MPIESVDRATVQAAIDRHVEAGSTLHTDESGAYSGIHCSGFVHDTVNHGAGEYVRGETTTNGIESVFAVLKRGLIGVYHHASPKHLDRYVDEFAFRLNEGGGLVEEAFPARRMAKKPTPTKPTIMPRILRFARDDENRREGADLATRLGTKTLSAEREPMPSVGNSGCA